MFSVSQDAQGVDRDIIVRPENVSNIVYIDGALAAADIDTAGSKELFEGFEPIALKLECSSAESHTVTFKNIRGKAPAITVCGAGSQCFDVKYSGKGSQCASFFIENFEERIAKYSPDLMVIILSANDRANVTLEEYECDIRKLFSAVFERFPKCGVLFLIPPSSRDPDNPESNTTPFISDALSEKYNAVTRRVVEAFSAEYNIEAFYIPALFEGEEVSNWRFDNIHLNQNGNKKLFEAVAQKLGI